MSPAATLALAEGLDFPLDAAATQVYAFMGRRGSGKTYGCGRLVEQLVLAGFQVVVVDPVGIWWGMRFASDGKKPSGFNIPVFGGWHGDLALPPTAGKTLAELVATRSTSMVLDVSDMTGADQRRFVGEFCASLLHAKKRHRSPVLVVFEEAQEFVPQHVRGDVAKMVGAVEKLVKLGRNFGIGAALISQRPQAVNKDVLNQTEVMLAFQLSGPQERDAIARWVQQTGAGDRAIANDLPALKTGEAMVWSPQWLRHFGKHRILKKQTFDASATPGGSKASEVVRALPPIDIEEVRTALQAAAVEVEDNDVGKLRAEVKKLRAQVAKGAPAASAKTIVQQVATVPPQLKRAVTDASSQAQDVGLTYSALVKALDSLSIFLRPLAKSIAEAKRLVDREVVNGATREVADPVMPPAGPPKTRTVAHEAIEGVAGDYKRGALRLLATLKEEHPKRMSARALATRCVMTSDGSTFRTYIGQLIGGGLVDRGGIL